MESLPICGTEREVCGREAGEVQPQVDGDANRSPVRPAMRKPVARMARAHRHRRNRPRIATAIVQRNPTTHANRRPVSGSGTQGRCRDTSMIR